MGGKSPDTKEVKVKQEVENYTEGLEKRIRELQEQNRKQKNKIEKLENDLELAVLCLKAGYSVDVFWNWIERRSSTEDAVVDGKGKVLSVHPVPAPRNETKARVQDPHHSPPPPSVCTPVPGAPAASSSRQPLALTSKPEPAATVQGLWRSTPSSSSCWVNPQVGRIDSTSPSRSSDLSALLPSKLPSSSQAPSQFTTWRTTPSDGSCWVQPRIRNLGAPSRPPPPAPSTPYFTTVKGHWRTTPSGGSCWVQPHVRKLRDTTHQSPSSPARSPLSPASGLTTVKGHWRTSKCGEKHWVKPHVRRKN